MGSVPEGIRKGNLYKDVLFHILVTTVSSWTYKYRENALLDFSWIEANTFSLWHSAISFLLWKFSCLCSSSAYQSPASHTSCWNARGKLQHCNGSEGAGRSTAKRKQVNACRTAWHNMASKNNFCSHTSINLLDMEAWEILRAAASWITIVVNDTFIITEHAGSKSYPYYDIFLLVACKFFMAESMLWRYYSIFQGHLLLSSSFEHCPLGKLAFINKEKKRKTP